MNKVKGSFVFVFLLFFGLIVGLSVNLVGANFVVSLPYITIKADGSVEPETGFINRVGDTYFLTANLSEYAIKIQCSNIIFDGQGYSINGAVTSSVGYGNNGLSLTDVSNVTIKNAKVHGFMNDDFWMGNSNNCSLINVHAQRMFFDNCSVFSFSRLVVSNFYLYRSSFMNVTESTVASSELGYLKIGASNNCVISRNNITSLNVQGGFSNLFFENNFFGEYTVLNSVNNWNNDLVGNYWSDYTTKYPNALEVNNTGIGNTPYTIDKDNVDNFPLMEPFKVASLESTPEFLPVTVFFGLGVSIFIAVTCLLFYFKKAKKYQKTISSSF